MKLTVDPRLSTGIETLNAGVRRPRHVAVELTQPGLFRCSAAGNGRYTADQLLAWAVEHAAEVALIRRQKETKHAIIADGPD